MKAIKNWVQWINKNPSKGYVMVIVTIIMLCSILTFEHPAIIIPIYIVWVFLFSCQLKKSVHLIIICALCAKTINAVEQPQKKSAGAIVGICVLTGGVIGAIILARKCSKWFGEKGSPSIDTNSPPAELGGVWPSDTNNVPPCYCTEMNDSTFTTSTPFQMSLSVKQGKVSLLSLGQTYGPTINVGEIGHWVNITGEKETPTHILIEWTPKLTDNWQPFVLVLAGEESNFTIQDQLNSAKSGFYRYQILK